MVSVAAVDMPGDMLPFLGTDIGGIQTHHIFNGNVIMNTKLVDLVGHHTGVPGRKTVTAGLAGDGATGGQQQNMLFGFHEPVSSLSNVLVAHTYSLSIIAICARNSKRKKGTTSKGSGSLSVYAFTDSSICWAMLQLGA